MIMVSISHQYNSDHSRASPPSPCNSWRQRTGRTVIGGGRLECIENTSTTPKLPVKFKGKNAKKIIDSKIMVFITAESLTFPRAKYFFLATPKYLSASLNVQTLA